MNITIVQTFTDGFTTYQSGQELSVPSEVAQRWIADGTAQADTDGQQSWLSSTEVAATRSLVSGDWKDITNPTALRAWRRRRALATPSGAFSRPAVVAFVGDSIVYGVQSNGSATETSGPNADGTYLGDVSWPEMAARIANARMGAVTPTVWHPQDARLTASNTTSVSSVGLAGSSRQVTSTGPGSIVTPTVAQRRFEVGYYETTTANSDTASGGFSIAVDGGAATNIPTAGASRVGKIATSAVLAAGSHYLTVTGITSAPAYITHLMGYTDGGIAVTRVGRGGWTLGDMLGLQANNSVSASGQGRLLSGFAQSAWHDMLLIECVHNDPTQYDLVQYSAYIDAVIAACPATMPIGLIAPPYPPTGQESAVYGVRTDYWDVMKSKAVEGSNVWHARAGSAFGAYADAYAAGLYAGASTVHPSTAGYGLLGQWLADLLTC